MNKAELVSAVAEKAGVSKVDAEGVLDAFQAVVFETVKKGQGRGDLDRVPQVRADHARRACGPQPGDGRGHQDPQEQGREDHRGREAEGCGLRQVIL